MNISRNNYNNRQSFGMAFEKPSNEVMHYLRGVVSDLNPQARSEFVERFTKIVEKAKPCPISIKPILRNNSYYLDVEGRYIADVGNTASRADIVLNRMSSAVEAAENIHNLNCNMKKIENCFDLKA